MAGLLRTELGRDVPSRALRAAVRSSAGNPLFALEIARAVVAGHDEGGLEDEPLPVPDSLVELVGRHVTALPEPTRAALAAAAALRRPTLAQLHALGCAEHLDAAGRAGLITRARTARSSSTTRCTPRPPITSSARTPASTCTPGSPRSPTARRSGPGIWRTAASTRTRRSPRRSTWRATGRSRRGAVDAALDAARLAVRTTPPGSAALVRRRLELGTLLFRAGDGEAARVEVTRAVEEADEPLARARRAVRSWAGSSTTASTRSRPPPIYLQALELAGNDPRLAADIHTGLAICYQDDWQTALEHGRTAIALVDALPTPDPTRAAKALAAVAGAQFYAGGGLDIAACRRAIELQEGDLSLIVSDRAIAVLFYLQFWGDDFAGARETMDAAYQLTLDEGDEGSRCYVVATRARLEVRAGRWGIAEELIDECLRDRGERREPDLPRHDELSNAPGSRPTAATWTRPSRPRDETSTVGCRPATRSPSSAAAGCAAGARSPPVSSRRPPPTWTATSNCSSRTTRPSRRCASSPATTSRRWPAPAGSPMRRRHWPRWWSRPPGSAARRCSPPRRGPRPCCAPSRAIVDRRARRRRPFAGAVRPGRAPARPGPQCAGQGADPPPVQAARPGPAGTRRRAGGLRGARREGFAARARIELSRLGSRGPATGELSETERQIAEQAARGLRSAEIGRTLFLSTKTVSANLTRIYQKLGVRNRAELVVRLNADGDHEVVSSRP